MTARDTIRAARERAERAHPADSFQILRVDVPALCDGWERALDLLREARDDLANYVAAEYPYREDYPDEMRRYKRDMDLVNRIDAALDGDS